MGSAARQASAAAGKSRDELEQRARPEETVGELHYLVKASPSSTTEGVTERVC